jgi:hypothetical protein
MVFKEEYLDVQVNGEDGGEFLAMLLNPDNGEVVCQGTGRSVGAALISLGGKCQTLNVTLEAA